MSSEELKPCPFCGGDVSFHKDEECPGCHLIQCGQCRDMVQPWPNTKTEARQTAKALGIGLVETYPAALAAQQGEGEKP